MRNAVPRWCRSVVLGLLVAAAVQAQAPPAELTVEAIFGAPGLRPQLVGTPRWSPDSKSLAYLRPTPAGQELWLLEVASGTERRLLDAASLAEWAPLARASWLQPTGPGRRPAPRFMWFPDSRALLLVGQEQLTRLELASGARRVLLRGGGLLSDVKISPDGRWVSFVRDYTVWAVDVASGQLRRLTPTGSESLRQGQVDWIYPEELGLFTAYWWSPDSARIAFLEFDERRVLRYPLLDPDSYDGAIVWMRYPRAGEPNPVVRLGTVSVAGGPVRWLASSPAGGYLPRVFWLASDRVAFETLDRAQQHLTLWVADVTTGSVRRWILEQASDWVNLGPDPYFFADGQVLWSSERSGFRHLYLYGADGRLLQTVTSGQWMVDTVAAVDPARGWVYFTATRDGPAQRTLYRVRLNGSGLERIGALGGTHEVDFAPDASVYLDTWSAILTPPRQELRTADGRLLRTLSDGRIAGLERYRLAPVEFLTVRAADGTPLPAAMIRPPDFDPHRRYPAIVFVYGGPTAQNVVDAWGGNRLLWHQLLAQRGIIVFWLDNRGAAGYGHRFEAALYRRFGSVEVEDQIAGARYLASLPYVDPARIGVWGWSYGGHMTLHLLLRAPEVFCAGVAVAPVTDWRQYDSAYTERYLGTPQENPEGYRTGSPVSYAEQLHRPLLLIHGTGDDNVHFSNTTEFIDRLIAAGLYARWVRLLAMPGRGHPISDRAAQLELYRAALAFWLEQLRPTAGAGRLAEAGRSDRLQSVVRTR